MDQKTPGKGRSDGRSKRLRFVPSDQNSIFAISEPFEATLSNTANPRIKKLRALSPLRGAGSSVEREPLSPGLAVASGSSPGPGGKAQTGGSEALPELQRELHVLDLVVYNILEAIVLVLDETPLEERHELTETIQNTLRRLVDIRRLAGRISDEEIRHEMSGILYDLQKLRSYTGTHDA